MVQLRQRETLQASFIGICEVLRNYLVDAWSTLWVQELEMELQGLLLVAGAYQVEQHTGGNIFKLAQDAMQR